MRTGIWSCLILIVTYIGGCAQAPELIEADCEPSLKGDYVDPLERQDLSIFSCPHPNGAFNVLMATDANISWPIIKSGRSVKSFEEQILDGPPELGDGLFYFDRKEDRVIWAGSSHSYAVISLTGANPTTLAKQRRWLAVDLSNLEIVGFTREMADAFSLF